MSRGRPSRRCRGLAGLLAILLAVWVAPATAVTTLKVATLAPDGSAWMERMRTGAAEVERRTGGRVAFRFFPGGVMGGDKAVLRRIRLGQLHGGALTLGGLAEIEPDTQLYSLPFTFRSRAEVEFVRARMDPVLEGLLERAGFISMGITDGGFAYLMSDRPVGSAEELKGAKVWVPEGDAIGRAALEAVGVSPISLPVTDVLTGLQTGLVDTVAASPAAAIALQWHTRVRYLTDTPLLYLYGALVLDGRAFGRLSAADQATVREVMRQVFAALDRQALEDDATAREALLRQGIRLVAPGPEERERWRAPVAAAMARLVEGGLLERSLMTALHRHLESVRGAAGAP